MGRLIAFPTRAAAVERTLRATTRESVPALDAMAEVRRTGLAHILAGRPQAALGTLRDLAAIDGPADASPTVFRGLHIVRNDHMLLILEAVGTLLDQQRARAAERRSDPA